MRISVAEGGGSKKKQDNVERKPKLQCRSEMKVKLRAANKGREDTMGKCTKHCQSGTTGEATTKFDFPGQLPLKVFLSVFLKKNI